MNSLKIIQENEWKKHLHQNLNLYNDFDPDELLIVKQNFLNEYFSKEDEFRPQILCVSYLERNNILIRSYDSKCECHHFAVTKMGPNGISLQLCDWHSGISKNNINNYTPLIEMCCIDSPSEYSVWESIQDTSGKINIICYDQCAEKRRIESIEESAFIQEINTLINSIKIDNDYIESEYQNFCENIKIKFTEKDFKTFICTLQIYLQKYCQINPEDPRIQNYFDEKDQDYINAVQYLWNWTQYLTNISNYFYSIDL